MPFTPFHLGPALLFGLILFPYLNLPTFVVANVIIDLEPLLVLFLGLPQPLHGPFHSLTLGSAVAFVLALVMHRLGSLWDPFLEFLRLQQPNRFSDTLSAALTGVWFHVLLDAFLYSELRLLYPLEGNPMLNLVSPGAVYGFCFISFPIALIVYLLRFLALPRMLGKG